MVLLDLFPAGSIQFKAVVEQGLWYGRSHDFVDYGIFNKLTWMRCIGASVFFLWRRTTIDLVYCSQREILEKVG